MAAALTFSSSTPAENKDVTVNGTGFSATTSYVLTITMPNGTRLVQVTSDGSGAFSHSFSVNAHFGTIKVDARPLTEHLGTTTATATATATPHA